MLDQIGQCHVGITFSLHLNRRVVNPDMLRSPRHRSRTGEHGRDELRRARGPRACLFVVLCLLKKQTGRLRYGLIPSRLGWEYSHDSLAVVDARAGDDAGFVAKQISAKPRDVDRLEQAAER